MAPAAAKVVPDLKGLNLAEAQARLSALGLHVTTTPVTVAGKTAGTVVDQAPKPGGKRRERLGGDPVGREGPARPPRPETATTTTRGHDDIVRDDHGGARPRLSRNRKAPPFRMCAVRQEAAAVQALGQAGILASLAFIPGSDPLGTVVAQAKSSGRTVPYHSHVQINISTRPERQPERPGAEHRRADTAGRRLDGAGREAPADLPQVPGHFTSAGGEDRAAVAALGRTAPQNAQILVFLGAYRPNG